MSYRDPYLKHKLYHIPVDKRKAGGCDLFHEVQPDVYAASGQLGTYRAYIQAGSGRGKK